MNDRICDYTKDVKRVKSLAHAIEGRLAKILPKVGDGPDIEVNQILLLARRLLEQLPSDKVIEIMRSVSHESRYLTAERFQRLIDENSRLRSEIAGFKSLPVSEPTEAMIDVGAQRLARWEDGCVWPDSWSPLQVAGMRKDARNVWISMLEAQKPAGGE